MFSLIPASLCLPAPRPSLLSQSQASDVVIVSSKYKQRYECRLPAGAIHFQREREEETPAYQGPGIPELLSPMKDAPCLLKVKGTGMDGMRAWELALFLRTKVPANEEGSGGPAGVKKAIGGVDIVQTGKKQRILQPLMTLS